MKHRVAKILSFSYGHRLVNYDGLCKNLHGHNARVEIELEADVLNKLGMVVDFVEIKEKLKNWIDENLDHRMLINKSDPWLATLQKLDPSVKAVPFNPTAENLAQLILEKGREMGLAVGLVRFWETESSNAVYEAGQG